MEDLLSCTVCCEQYHEKYRQPVLLPRCGHSFCRPCIALMLHKGCIMCPSCRMDQRVEGADSLPTEFSLLAISLAQQVTKQETCQDHGVKLSFWCKTCNVPACGECLFEDHPMTSHVVIKSTSYVNEMKEGVTSITNKFMEALDGREKCFFEKIFISTKMINDSLRTITVLRKDMEEARELMKGVKVVDGIGPTKAISESAKFLGLKWNLQDVNLNLHPVPLKKEKASKEIPEELAIVETEPTEPKIEEEKLEVEEKDSATNNSEVTVNGTSEKDKASDEIEKDSDDEEEVLTEEELRKRRKIQRLKERLAAASAAAEQAKQESKETIGSKKEKVDDGKKTDEAKVSNEEKAKTLTSKDSYNTATKNLKPWQRKSKPWEPTPREPSITPEKEIVPKGKEKSIEEEPEKTTENSTPEGKTDDPSEADKNKKTDDELSKESKEGSNKETSDPVGTLSKENSSTSTKEADSVSTTDADNAESKKSLGASTATKRPRGRLARNALKRAQTMDFSKKLENSESDTTKDAESEDIKGLDLEKATSKNSGKPQVKNKEAETQTDPEIGGDASEPKTEDENKVEASTAKSNDVMFEMEPEEKERITTELLQVPSLTVCIEGIGGLLARVSWESMGLHVYSHQIQELPYDIVVKSNVLHALIPTKDPMVFLDIGTDDQNLGRVYISLWGHLRRANNMLLLCLGDRGRSLRLSRFFGVLNIDSPGERLLGGDYEYNDGNGGESLIDDLEYQGQYNMPMEMGLITSATGGNRGTDSQFYICTEEDLNRQFACPYGRVVVGLPILKEAVWLAAIQQVYIQECGICLDCPRI